MPLALVTGATGMVGANLVQALVEQGWRVRALRRATSPTASLEDLPHEVAIGDVLDADSLRAAMQGCDVVFHVAGVSDHWRAGKAKMYQVNVEGVRLVAEAAVAARVGRVVLTSSVAALGIPPHGQLLTEEDSFNVRPERFPYGHSKFLGEQELRKVIQEKGLDGVIVNPGAVLGPRDAHLGSATVILQMKRLSLPFLPDGGMNLVDAHDVAVGQIAAAERGRTGERYILGGHNISHIELTRIIGAELGKKVPLRRAPARLLLAFAHVVDVIKPALPPDLPLTGEIMRHSTETFYVKTDKADRELGLPHTPVEATVGRTAAWLREKGHLK
ncbi:MAG: SDR family NAD(P)-dependent oxidoreductase [Anaerolineae bacterium]|nr:SDR family NAD(P)-dependent oxidoreductase [Anaerolineae bacterium]